MKPKADLHLFLFIFLTVFLVFFCLSYAQEKKELDIFEIPLGQPVNNTPHTTNIDAEDTVSLRIGSTESAEKDSFDFEDIKLGEPYRSREFRNETQALEEYPFPPLGKPYKIQSELQEKAIKQQGY